ncbi:protein-tyrosine phosphatase-like protein [Linnemannia elongata]|nr:protein-tyrosine phosphatase-like protein [Linnemannia elongata]
MAVNCDDDLWVQRFGQSGYLKVGLRDHVDQDLKDGLDEAVKFIASSKTPIYVHCQAGKSRSVATVIGYLIQEHQWPLKRAYDHVVERRRCMSPNIGFVSQLILLEKRVLGSDKANGLVSVGNSDDLDPSSRTTVVSWMTS